MKSKFPKGVILICLAVVCLAVTLFVTRCDSFTNDEDVSNIYYENPGSRNQAGQVSVLLLMPLPMSR
jgi:hypothetical protein